MLWKSKPLISDDLADWIVESFAWHLTRWPKLQSLVLPNREFFKAPKGTTPLATGEAVLSDIARLIGISDRAFTLALVEELAPEWSHSYHKMGEVAGQYFGDEDQPTITVSHQSLSEPIRLINTLSHEVMHDLLRGQEHLLPGGLEAAELSTDLHTILKGFGLFQMQAASDLGWSGYMSQPSRAYALDLFIEVADPQARPQAERFLTSRPLKLLRQAAKMERRDGDIQTLKRLSEGF